MTAADFERVVTAKRRAEAERTSWLSSEEAGLVSPADIIGAACAPGGEPLLRMTLLKLLSHQPGWGEARALRAIHRMCRQLGAPTQTPRRLTIAWLVDSRTGGHRLQAFCDALTDPALPWPGFPYAPQQKGAFRGEHS